MSHYLCKFLCLSLTTFSLSWGTVTLAAEDAATVSDGRSSLNASELKYELLAIPSASRDSVASDKRRLARYVENILSNRRAMEAAGPTDIPESAEVRAETAKARREAIARIYIERLLAKAEAQLPPREEFVALAKERYLANARDYAVPESIRVAHILFNVDAEKMDEAAIAKVRAKGEEVLAELRAGADFAKLAEQYSEDKGSAKTGGVLPGYGARGKFVPPFERVAFSLQVGELSELVRTRFGYHIIKLLERRPAATRPFEEVRDGIVEQLRAQRMTASRSEIMQAINGTQEVVIDDAFLEALKR